MCGFELGVVLDIYGIPMYSAALWLVIFWQVNNLSNLSNLLKLPPLQVISWGDASANPASHLVKWWAGEQGAGQGVIR